MRKAIVLNPKDNVAVALKNLSKGEEVEVHIGETVRKIKVNDDIPLGHKFALKNLARGEHVIKYGEVIGVATEDIKIGDYVHIHNVESLRGRGDKPKSP